MRQRLIITALLCFIISTNVEPVTAQWFLGNLGGQGQGPGQSQDLFGGLGPSNQGQGLFGLIANAAAMGQTTTTSTSTTTLPPPSSESTSETTPPSTRNDDALESINPCVSEVVTMTRVQGEIVPETNYWDGHVDLSDYSYLKSIKLVIKVDHPARIVVDPSIGTVTSPVRGTIFRVTYFGSPPEVTDVTFKIFGTSGKNFPNLVSLHLNNRDICMGPAAVRSRHYHYFF